MLLLLWLPLGTPELENLMILACYQQPSQEGQEGGSAGTISLCPDPLLTGQSDGWHPASQNRKGCLKDAR